MIKDLTVGKPEKVLWRFCIPLFGSVIFQQFYNLADSFVAGKFIGENALACRMCIRSFSLTRYCMELSATTSSPDVLISASPFGGIAPLLP